MKKAVALLRIGSSSSVKDGGRRGSIVMDTNIVSDGETMPMKRWVSVRANHEA